MGGGEGSGVSGRVCGGGVWVGGGGGALWVFGLKGGCLVVWEGKWLQCGWVFGRGGSMCG